jgi:hypothetical protein
MNQNVKEKLDEMRHLYLDLAPPNTKRTDTCHRPKVSFWASLEETGPEITISIGALHGQQQRFVSLSIHEAQHLSNMLQALSLDVKRTCDVHSQSGETQ